MQDSTKLRERITAKQPPNKIMHTMIRGVVTGANAQNSEFCHYLEQASDSHISIAWLNPFQLLIQRRGGGERSPAVFFSRISQFLLMFHSDLGRFKFIIYIYLLFFFSFFLFFLGGSSSTQCGRHTHKISFICKSDASGHKAREITARQEKLRS